MASKNVRIFCYTYILWPPTSGMGRNLQHQNGSAVKPVSLYPGNMPGEELQAAAKRSRSKSFGPLSLLSLSFAELGVFPGSKNEHIPNALGLVNHENLSFHPDLSAFINLLRLLDLRLLLFKIIRRIIYNDTFFFHTLFTIIRFR